ncbi:MAG: ATP-dependent DNA helicase RecG [Candidatus Saccharibacteria bacterium]|nr:ATP-dependent DNA helicase RecG [Candidatus Saccharibacteria bacterium]
MDFFAPVDNLKGVGPKTAEILGKYGIKTVKDLFYNLPRDYENYEAPTTISEMRPGKVVIRGKISDLTTRRAKRRNLSVTEGIISDQTGSVKVVWFNQGYRARQFTPEKEYFFTGNFEFRNGRYSLVSPSAAEVSHIDARTGLAPIYVAHGGLKSSDFQRIMTNSRDKFTEIPDLLPTVRSGARKHALFHVHFPDSLKAIERARNYLAYEELFELILASKLNRRENEKLKAEPIPFNLTEVKRFLAQLPFALTKAQKKAAWEIFQDMEKKSPMNRLLQGDVGSGKTMVAALATYGAALSGHQIALLAPTAILATQHFDGLSKLLGGLKVNVALLTGATKGKKELKQQIKAGEVDVVIGTHALLTDDTEFAKLGLVIIDEQHRFGVEQRQKLMLKSPSSHAPHLLAMTATPIPRSLQLTVFGDLDVSILDELPKGRQPIQTQILKEIETREQLYPSIVDTVAAGHQVYWICKAIDDNSRTETTSVKTRAAKLQALFPKLKIEYLHGRMKPAEKDAVMERFARGEIDVLVSTTVVEVGVDVPNATLMVIENAESYGLAQLHQLRGRVGRGSVASECFLLTAGDFAPSKRLRELEKSNDGFHLAEVDLKLRGPGEIYGALQHGALDLRIATFSDTKLIHQAQKDVAEFLKIPENMVKYEELMTGIKRYQQITTLN